MALGVVILLAGVAVLGWRPANASAATPTPTTGYIIILPTNTAPVIVIQPSRTPTSPSSSIQTWTHTPTRTPTPTVSPTQGVVVVPSFTATVEFGAEMPPTITPHGDPFEPQFPLTLPSETPTQVTFKGPEVPDLYITDFEVTQGMQNLENDMPLVQERTTVARVYVCTDSVDWPDVRGGIQAWRNDQPLSPGAGESAGKALLPANGPITAWANCGDRLNVDDSLYFYLPPHWLNGEVTLRAFVYGTDPHAPSLYEESDANNFKSVYDLEFDPAQAAVFRFIPMHLHAGFDNDNADATFFPSPITFGTQGGWDIANDMFRLHPVAEVYVELAGEAISPAFHGFGDEWELDDEDKYGKPLDLLQYYRHWEDNAPWYVGMVSPTLLDDADGNLGLARGDKGVAWAIMDSSHWNSTRWNVNGGATLAHELGHLSGLDHAPCADNDGDGEPDEADVDGDFPTGFPNCKLAPVDPEGFYGFDVNWQLWSYTSGPTVISNDPGASQPHRGFPLMGYANPSYIDAYHYCVLLEHYGVHCNPASLDLGPQGGGGGTGPHADCDTFDNPFPGPLVNWEMCLTSEGEPELYQPTTYDSVIAVSGQVDPQAGTATFDLVTRLSDPPESLLAEMAEQKERWTQDGESSPYRLSLETADGTALVFLPLIDSTTHHSAANTISFSEVLPDVPGGALLRIRQGDAILGEHRASSAPPSISVEPAADASAQPPFEIRWQASDPDGDSLSFTLLYSHDLGETWRAVATDVETDGDGFAALVSAEGLPGSTQGMFRIVANDGFHTALDDSQAVYQVPNQLPLPLIYIPGEGLVLPTNGVVVLKGAATDAEDGPLPAESLQWSSDRDGPLGQGGLLVRRDLSPGLHTLTLSATDSAGQTATAVVHIAVDPNVVRWLPSPEEQSALDAVLAEAGGPGEPTAPAARFVPPAAVVVGVALAAALGLAGLALLVLALRRRAR
jgi:hypothetical protein